MYKKDERLLTLINDFYNYEQRAANLYTYIASLINQLGASNVGCFIKKLANDKICSHLTRTYDYIISINKIISINEKSVPNNASINISNSEISEFSINNKIISLINIVIESELHLRNEVHKIAELALDIKDFETYEYIGWFIKDSIKDINEIDELLTMLTVGSLVNVESYYKN